VKRREFLCASVAVCVSTAASAQNSRRIGIVHGSASYFSRGHPVRTEFLAAMKDLGYQEGRNCTFDFREWKAQSEIPGIARDLVNLGCAVIVASAPPSILGVRSVTDRVPIIMVASAEPVATGLVRSLKRPGGNVTGLTWDHGFDSALKQLELVREALPAVSRVALIWDSTDAVHPIYASHFVQAAKLIRLDLGSYGLRDPTQFAPTFDEILADKAQALIVLPSAQLTLPHRAAILDLAAKRRLPTMTGPVYLDHPGALLIWAPSQAHVPRRTAAFVDRILKGANPAELPIEQPDHYLLHVDLRVARSLGITLPQSVLVRADRLIE
jgi:putative tryptophan/tyrosine transport system substrate-binding protein